MLPCIMITSPLLAYATALALASAVPAAVAHGVRLDKEVRQDKARQGKARPGQARPDKARQTTAPVIKIKIKTKYLYEGRYDHHQP